MRVGRDRSGAFEKYYTLLRVTHTTGPLWTPADLGRLLSPGRFAKYVQATGGDQAKAAELYVWNSRISGALYESCGQFEVILRNALDEQLAEYHRRRRRGDGLWYADARMPWANPKRTLETIKTARDRATSDGRDPEIPGKVVAELSMGFWRLLLASSSQMSLWAPALYRAFPHMRPTAQRHPVYERVNRLNDLRNRIAHHEPIHRKNLAARFGDLLQVAAWIDPAAAAWIDETSRVQAVLADRP